MVHYLIPSFLCFYFVLNKRIDFLNRTENKHFTRTGSRHAFEINRV